VTDLCRKHGFSSSSFYKWKAKYGGLDAPALCSLKELEEENRRLRAMYAELSLEHRVLKEIVERSCNGR
jgi:putative transposase